MSLHQDRGERDFGVSVASVSLGQPIVFLFGGMLHNLTFREVR